MRVFISLFLSLIVYSFILFFLFSILQFKKPEKKEVLVHTAVVVKKVKKVEIKKSVVKKQIKKVSAKHEKLKTKSAFTKGGDNIKFEDIFKDVKYNVKTHKIRQKSQLDMSRLKGIEQKLNKIENLKINISVNSNNNKKVDIDEISKKLGIVWDKISSNAGDYAIIRVISNKNSVESFIIDTNLNMNLQKVLISEIKKLHFNEEFDITVKFHTKGS